MENTFTNHCSEMNSHPNLPDTPELIELNEEKSKLGDCIDELKCTRKSARIQSKKALEQDDSDETKSFAESKSFLKETKPTRRKKSKIHSNDRESSLKTSSDELSNESMLDDSINNRNSKVEIKKKYVKKEKGKINSVVNYFTVDRKTSIQDVLVCDDDKNESAQEVYVVDSIESSPELSPKNKKRKETIKPVKAKQKNSLDNYFAPKVKPLSNEKEVIVVKDTENPIDEADKNVDSISSTNLDVKEQKENGQIIADEEPVNSSVSNINSSVILDVKVKEQNDPQIITEERSLCYSEFKISLNYDPMKNRKIVVMSSMNCDDGPISLEDNHSSTNRKRSKKRKRQKSTNADLDVDHAESDSKSPLDKHDEMNGSTQNDECIEIDENDISDTTCHAELLIPEEVVCQNGSSLEKTDGCNSISSTDEKQNDSSARKICSTVKSKRKNRTKCLENSEADLTSSSTTIVKPISDRKLSLRNKGQRNTIVKYSDDDQNCYFTKENKSSKTRDNNILGVSDKKPKEELKIGKSNVRNIERDVKLFPIFSPKSNHPSSKSVKRKAEAIKESSGEEEGTKILKKNKLKEKSEVGAKAKDLPSKRKESQNDNANYKDEPISSKEKLKPDQNEIVVIEKDDHDKSNHMKSANIACESMSVKQAHIKPKLQPASYPVFSHIDVYDDALLCPLGKTCKFTISDNKENEDVVPTPGKTMGLVDIEYLLSEIPNMSKMKKNLTDDVTGSNETLLWTDISEKPITESENLDTVKEIKSWLLQWKNKFSSTSNPTFQSEDYFSSDSDDDFMSNCIIISGALGSGKTSTVFCLAKELGFTVLEMNASSCRSGRHVSSQLKEALESYHVENIKISDIFSGTTSNKLEEKEILKKESKSKRPKNLKNFFGSDAAKNENKEPTSQRSKTIANFFIKDNKTSDSKPMTKSTEKSVKKMSEDLGKNSYKISGLTIILFDDADVVFEEDEGFWGTVKGFLKISKKPVIFTVSRNLHIVKSILNADIQVFHMQPSTKDTAVRTLKSYCRVHCREKAKANLELLTSHNVCDMRRNLLNAQFWTQLPLHDSIEDSLWCSSLSVFKQLDVNTFIAGALPFSTHHIKRLLFGSSPEALSHTVCQFLSLGYDIFFCNLFSFFYDFKSGLAEKLWNDLTAKQSSPAANTFGDSEMWKEACEIFERKKKAFKSGSSSKELKNFADALDDFSFADTLKSQSQSPIWSSVPERIRMWTAGLPVWSEHNSSALETTLLDIASLIQIYLLRRLKNLNCSSLSESTNDTELDLEHPFLNFDCSITCEAEDNLDTISSVLPSSYLLNKSALILDYLSTIKIMCLDEKNRQLTNDRRRGRFLHYFDSISFYINKKEF